MSEQTRLAGERGEGVGPGRGPAGMAEGGPRPGASQRRDEAEDERVEPRAVIRETSVMIEVRRGDLLDDVLGLWIKPETLDGDGEFHLTVANIAPALKILGINRADVFPDG